MSHNRVTADDARLAMQVSAVFALAALVLAVTPEAANATTASDSVTWVVDSQKRFTVGQPLTIQCKVPGYSSRHVSWQTDGNLVAYNGGTAIWATHTNGRGHDLALQTDGNVVIYSVTNAVLWATNTSRIGALGAGTVVHFGTNTFSNILVYVGGTTYYHAF